MHIGWYLRPPLFNPFANRLEVEALTANTVVHHCQLAVGMK